jgi:hypothetical protein
LPPEVAKALKDPLHDIGLDLGDGEVQDPWGNAPRRYPYTLLRNHELQRHVVHVKDDSLDTPSTEAVDEVQALAHAFKRRLGQEEVLYLLFGTAYHATFDQIINEVWPEMGVRCTPRPLRHLVDLLEVESEQRTERLRIFFGLATARLPPDLRPNPRALSGDEMERVISIISDLHDYMDKGRTGWRRLLADADLGDEANDFDLNGSPSSVASQVLRQLRKIPQRPDRPDACPLGLLLRFISNKQGVPVADADFLRTLIANHRLLPPSYHP